MTAQRTFNRIAPAELDTWLAQHPSALLLDARDAENVARGSLPGSLRLSRDNQDELLLRTDKRRPVLIYCYHGHASQTWARMFADFGFASVHDLIDGYAGWARSRAAAAPQARPLAPELAGWLAHEGFADPQARGAHGNTPLMVAAWRGAADIVEALLRHGVPLDAVNNDGNNALWLACVHGDPKGVETLAAAGVPIDHANLTGATCLMYAASAGKAQIARALLALGANPGLRSQDDYTALDMAASLDCLQLLRHA